MWTARATLSQQKAQCTQMMYISEIMPSQLKRNPKPIFTVICFLILCGLTSGRFISDSPDFIADGVRTRASGGVPSYLRLYMAEESCEQTYGFMPCTTTALGNVFLIIVYGYLMFLAATYLSAGSELLLQILGPGIVGGLFLPILGALPDAMLILGIFLVFSEFC